MLQSHIILAFLWILYCVLHSVLASLAVKRKAQSLMGNNFRHYRLLYTLFAAFGLVALVYYQVTISTIDVFKRNIFTTIVGGIFGFAGVSIMLICIRKYFASLSGIKSLVEEKPATELMIAGIHRYMRHPLYLGTFLAIWGLWLLLPVLSLLIVNSVITIYTIYAIRLEEQKLVAEFGDQYRTYQKTVPKLIPRL